LGNIDKIIKANGYNILAKVEVEELKPQHISAGDVVIIPSMHPQRITIIGTEYLFFLASCLPRFTENVYENMD
jgi:hypothetical protein